MTLVKRLIGVTGILSLLACSSGPEPIAWGIDACDQCRMIITDKRFGAELLASRGQIHKFDGVDELAKFLASHDVQGTAYVTSGEQGVLVLAQSAVYLSSPDIRSPMGGSLMAFAERAQAEAYAAANHLNDVRFLSYGEALTGSGDAHR